MGAIVGEAVLGLLLVLLIPAVIVLCIITRGRQKRKKMSLTHSQR